MNLNLNRAICASLYCTIHSKNDDEYNEYDDELYDTLLNIMNMIMKMMMNIMELMMKIMNHHLVYVTLFVALVYVNV